MDIHYNTTGISPACLLDKFRDLIHLLKPLFFLFFLVWLQIKSQLFEVLSTKEKDKTLLPQPGHKFTPKQQPPKKGSAPQAVPRERAQPQLSGITAHSLEKAQE